MADVQNERPVEETNLGTEPSPCGTGMRDKFLWNEDHSGLEKVGTVNQQEMIDAAAKGLSAGEQIARILRGDYTCFLAGDGITGDITGAAEKTSGEVLHEVIKPIQKATQIAQDNGLSLQELEKKIAEIQAEIDLKKQEENQKVEEKQNA